MTAFSLSKHDVRGGKIDAFWHLAWIHLRSIQALLSHASYLQKQTQLYSMSMDQHLTQGMHIANRQRLFLLVGSCLGCTLEATCSPGSNETNLLSRGCIPAYCGGVTNMLMVTTTVRVLYRVHSHTTNLPSTNDCQVLYLHTDTEAHSRPLNDGGFQGIQCLL